MSEGKIGVTRERLPFTMLENGVFLDRALSKSDLLVYWALCFHADGEGKCFPSLSRLCKEARISRGNIMGCLKNLTKHGYLSVASRLDPAGDKASNLYVIKALKGVVQSRDYLVQSSNDGVVQSGDGGSSIPLQELDSLNKTKKTLSPSAHVSARKTSAERMRRLRDRQKALPSHCDKSDAHSDSESISRSRSSYSSEYAKDFETFWAAYPRKVEKTAAFAKYKATLKKGATAEELLSAVRAYAAACSSDGTESRFIKYAKTFLGPAEPWRDHLQVGNNGNCEETAKSRDEVLAEIF